MRLSTAAKIAAVVATVGGGFAIYGRIQELDWASGAGTLLLFGGAIVYFFERFRMMRKR